jgi:hypothetical protein
MAKSFPGSFYAGLSTALATGLLLCWFWRPEHQVDSHTGDLLRGVEHKNWSHVRNLIAPEYTDQWGNDQTLVLQRLQEAFTYIRGIRIEIADPKITADRHRGIWQAGIKIDSDAGEMGELVKQRVNSLKTPFELEWRRMSARPWDWKLVHVSNSELEIRTDFD